MDRDTLAALDGNFLDVSRLFMECSDPGEYIDRSHVAISCCGLPAEELNWGFLRPPYEDVAATAEEVRGHFAARELPFRLTLREDEAPRAAAELEARGWHRQENPMPGMALEPLPAPPSGPDGVAIQEVRSATELVAFREAAFRGFGYPSQAAHLFINERLQALPQVRCYAGRVDGEVVATSMLAATGDVAGIYWVATLEAHRGRGFGEALTWAAVEGGRELGCRIASLQASEMGRPVYTRMGFEHVLDYTHYSPPRS